MFKGVPMKIVLPIIVITWVLSLISSLAIVAVVPDLLGIKVGIDEGAVTSDKIAAGAIITVKMADGSVTSAKILDGTITAQDMADGSIVTVKVADGTITTAKIVDGAVTEAKIADNAILTVKLADESVTTAKLADNAVVTIKLADGAVTSAKILDGTITTADLADNTVTAVKIADGAVTMTKIADYAVTDTKLAAGAIPHNETSSSGVDTTDSMGFVDIPDASVELTLNRNSTLIITFSAMTFLTGSGTPDIYWRAMVNSTQANPATAYLIITKSTDYGSNSFTFYLPDVEPGKYTIKMQWRVYQSTTTGNIYHRSLIVIALPA